jgi:acyl carrier protein
VAYSKYDLPASRRLTCDLFVLEPETQDIVLTILSIEFQKVSIKSLKKVLGILNSDAPPVQSSRVQCIPAKENFCRTGATLEASAPTPRAAVRQSAQLKGSTSRDLLGLQNINEMLRDVLHIPLDDITHDTVLEDLGVDSLLATGLFTEMNKRFGVSISPSGFTKNIDVRGLSQVIPILDTTPYPNPPSGWIPTPQSSPASAVILHQPVQGEYQTLEGIQEMLGGIF